MQPDKLALGSNLPSTGDGAIHPEKPFIKKNHDSVASCHMLMAYPETGKEVRSGTWAPLIKVVNRIKKHDLLLVVFNISY